jgi:hypothetical protein
MGDGEGSSRRTAFGKDLRELLLKLALGCVFGLVLYFVTAPAFTFGVAMVLGVLGSFILAHSIRGSSRTHAD